MSHRLRHEKDCLNCGQRVEARYCPHCGQENLIPRESFGHIMTHFVTDYLHLDQKFFSGIRPLLFKPGFLTNEYNAGRRARYVHPFKLYIFISVMFFLIAGLHHHYPSDANSQAAHQPDVMTMNTQAPQSSGFPKDKASYIARQASLPAADRDGPVVKFLVERLLGITEKGYSIPQKLDEGMIKNSPKVAFLLLPVLALLFKVLFRKERLFYVEHFYHAVYLQSFTFILFGTMQLLDMVLFGELAKFVALLLLIIPFHLYFSCRHVYQEGRFVTAFKTLLAIIGYVLFLLVFTSLGLVYSVLTI